MKLSLRRSKRSAACSLKPVRNTELKKTRSVRVSKLVKRSLCAGSKDLHSTSPSFDPDSVLNEASNRVSLTCARQVPLRKPVSRRQSALVAVQNLRKRFSVKARNQHKTSTDTSEACNENLESFFQHAQHAVTNRIYSLYGTKNCSQSILEQMDSNHPHVKASLSSISSFDNTYGLGAAKCSLVDVTISNIRLNLMWTEKQHFVYSQKDRRATFTNVVKTANRKFALLCVAIAFADDSETGQQTRQSVSCSQRCSMSFLDRHKEADSILESLHPGNSASGVSLVDEHGEQSAPRSVQVACSEIVRDVDWSATDVVFKSPLRFAFRCNAAPSTSRCVTRSQSNSSIGQKDRSRTSSRLNEMTNYDSNGTRNASRYELDANANAHSELIRLEFYAIPYNPEGADVDEHLEDVTKSTRKSVLHDSKSANFRLIATADLPLNYLERRFENGQVVKAQAATRAQFLSSDYDCNTTVAHTLERLPAALEPNGADVNRQTSKRKQLSVSSTFKAAVRRLSDSAQSVAASSASVLASDRASESDDPSFRIPLFGAFTFALRVNAFDVQASFV